MSNPAWDPQDIAPNADATALRIVWGDGEFSEYTPRELRIWCPCAACVEEMTGRPILDPAMVSADISLTKIEYVGRYALRFVWDDGHSTGIFPFEYLRKKWDEGPADPAPAPSGPT